MAAAAAAAAAGSPPDEFDYDLAVIGGGSGGLALAQEAAKRAAALKKPFKVVVFDFVSPTPNTGTTWGLGGTCVNVGCIPKKLMHFAAHGGHSLQDAAKMGWQWQPAGTTLEYGQKAPLPPFSWQRLVEGVQDHIGSLNWGYRVALRDKDVEYVNAHAKLTNAWTLEATTRAKKTSTHTARNIVVATGGRPTLLDIPGAEHAITSDDIFSLDRAPGKTLLVGASYIALECASFLAGVGFDTTVMVRSIFLRGYDQEVAEMVGETMRTHAGVKFIRPATPTRIERAEVGEGDTKMTRLRVFWNDDKGNEVSEDFDTVVAAVGRGAETAGLGLETAGVTTIDERTGKIRVNDLEQTNIDHIYALGDVIYGRPELTPVAIQTGRRLARRLVDGATIKMDYNFIPTTVFTHVEYSCVGLSEEEAAAQGKIEVYHSYFKPLEWTVTERPDNVCFAKVITSRPDDDGPTTGDEKVLGLHYFGPHAGEVVAGFAAAMRLGMTKNDLDATVGVHPTSAEELTNLNLTVTKRSGDDAKKTGC